MLSTILYTPTIFLYFPSVQVYITSFPTFPIPGISTSILLQVCLQYTITAVRKHFKYIFEIH